MTPDDRELLFYTKTGADREEKLAARFEEMAERLDDLEMIDSAMDHFEIDPRDIIAFLDILNDEGICTPAALTAALGD